MSTLAPAHALSHAQTKQGAWTRAWAATGEAFWIALEALASHKLRSILTLLGVVIATATLIAVMSVINVSAVTPSMMDIGQQQVEYGRYISDTDYQHSSAVSFIGQDLVRDLFPNSDPLDKEILLNGLPFRVIGVAKALGNTFGQSQDNFALIPLTTYRKTFVALPRVNVNVQAWNDRQMYALEDQVRALMRARRHTP